MANIPSAEKRNRQTEKRRERNRAGRSKLRSAIKKSRAAIDEGGENSTAMLSETFSIIDKAAKHSLIKKNAANRYKSRIAQRAKRAASQG